MSPVGSIACVSCLIYIRPIRLIRVRFNTSCLRFTNTRFVVDPLTNGK